jgi:hypothetical protein
VACRTGGVGAVFVFHRFDDVDGHGRGRRGGDDIHYVDQRDNGLEWLDGEWFDDVYDHDSEHHVIDDRLHVERVGELVDRRDVPRQRVQCDGHRSGFPFRSRH